ncbi:type III PLP-dependent enzyme domain-containing protein [Chitinophaga sancti]|uniref:Arginine decarboxylase n=1 Tax=Chitinophaga sancti TaxID=1004 RepID=A0A1K1LVI0_9BACT|nr:arginine decarboxylase [Chitinophaga sancti]WQD64816.1 arginine decarboxylase [Chitinophaga sancti]WQG89560.1 arginine decarboxylase [Chitinophaga sancti]SFW14871.1 arginine decarboxylase [Chitinophaga sancti]
MNSTYTDLVNQTFEFPQEGFDVQDGYLEFNGVNIKELIDKYGTPFKLTYLPKIGMQINKAKKMFQDAIKKNRYDGNYYYCYCTKSSHFSFIMEETLKHGIHIETSFAYDIDIITKLYERKKINKETKVICNGYKTKAYTKAISKLVNTGFKNVIPVLDNKEELEDYQKFIRTKERVKLGLRIAAEEEPTFDFYTSRLGIRSRDVLEFYIDKLKGNEKFELKMLHFFMNKGIKDDVYYWSQFNRVLQLYCQLKKISPELDSINIGGGFPIKHSLGFDYDYNYMVNEIVATIKSVCKKNKVPVPDIYTEFGSFTVGESGAVIYSVVGEKMQNDREIWYMIDSSFITTLPDTWGIGEKFLMLPINKWEQEYQEVHLGGLTCDGYDFYTSEEHINAVFLPKVAEGEPLYIGFFHTGAYQDQLSGYGGIKHCLIPSPKHVVIGYDKNGQLKDWLYAKEQSAQSMLKILGY